MRASLSRLLWWGTIFAILQGPILLLAQGPASTIVVAVLYGLFGGFATAAYIDLIMRSCPKGLEGTAMMVANTSTFALAGSAGNLLGSWIYSRGWFASAGNPRFPTALFSSTPCRRTTTNCLRDHALSIASRASDVQ